MRLVRLSDETWEIVHGKTRYGFLLVNWEASLTNLNDSLPLLRRERNGYNAHVEVGGAEIQKHYPSLEAAKKDLKRLLGLVPSKR